MLGSYSLGIEIFHSHLMPLVGIAAYVTGAMADPISPPVIGVILGPMAEENLRRALMVSDGSLERFVARPVAAIPLVVVLLAGLANFRPTGDDAGVFRRRRWPNSRPGGDGTAAE